MDNTWKDARWIMEVMTAARDKAQVRGLLVESLLSKWNTNQSEFTGPDVVVRIKDAGCQAKRQRLDSDPGILVEEEDLKHSKCRSLVKSNTDLCLTLKQDDPDSASSPVTPKVPNVRISYSHNDSLTVGYHIPCPEQEDEKYENNYLDQEETHNNYLNPFETHWLGPSKIEHAHSETSILQPSNEGLSIAPLRHSTCLPMKNNSLSASMVHVKSPSTESLSSNCSLPSINSDKNNDSYPSTPTRTRRRIPPPIEHSKSENLLCSPSRERKIVIKKMNSEQFIKTNNGLKFSDILESKKHVDAIQKKQCPRVKEVNSENPYNFRISNCVSPKSPQATNSSPAASSRSISSSEPDTDNLSLVSQESATSDRSEVSLTSQTTKSTDVEEELQSSQSQEPSIIQVYTAYESGLSPGTSVKLKVTSATTVREVVNLVVKQLNMALVLKGRNGPIYRDDELETFCLVAVIGARERCLRDNFRPLLLQNPWRKGRLFVRLKTQVLAAIDQNQSQNGSSSYL